MPAARYAPWIRRLHWLVFLLVTGALVLIYTREWTARGTTLHAEARWAHTQFGIAVLLLMLPRLFVRVRGSAPPIAPPPPRWQNLVAKTVHVALYVLLFATPILGVTMMVLTGRPWSFLGIPLPHLATPDRPLAHQLEHFHGTCGNILMYLAAVHAAIALFHHFVQRDDTLERMLPPS
jgi:superoxide oxidase